MVDTQLLVPRQKWTVCLLDKVDPRHLLILFGPLIKFRKILNSYHENYFFLSTNIREFIVSYILIRHKILTSTKEAIEATEPRSSTSPTVATSDMPSFSDKLGTCGLGVAL
jgi:hypothetical protein